MTPEERDKLLGLLKGHKEITDKPIQAQQRELESIAGGVKALEPLFSFLRDHPPPSGPTDFDWFALAWECLRVDGNLEKGALKNANEIKHERLRGHAIAFLGEEYAEMIRD